jgi:L-serine dehydratase
MIQVDALDLFTIGIGPSSSHTVGPMRASCEFANTLHESDLLPRVAKLQITLYGSLGATGAGHGTTNAIVAGLGGQQPESCSPQQVVVAWQNALDASCVFVLGHRVSFSAQDLVLKPMIRLPKHSNGMTFEAFDSAGGSLLSRTYYSVGGGFIERHMDEAEFDSQAAAAQADIDAKKAAAVPFGFASSSELVELCQLTNQSIAQVAWQNSVARYGERQAAEHIDSVWAAMADCVEAGLQNEGVLPGYLNVSRRAKAMREQLELQQREGAISAEQSGEWLQAYAIAVNEENAAGMRVVTAPTNGAAGIIPAVGYFALKFKGVSPERLAREYLMTAGAIGQLYKSNASISGAEAGCQGEVGSACSMAAAGLTAVLGGTVRQVENAAEIAMEHNLGLTCDPVGGFVQMPCIERNAIAAGTAVAATRLALLGDGNHKISLDTVIETMRQTGLDMSSKYKETSLGGLAVNVVEC